MGYLWNPHPGPQTEFCRRGEYEVLYGGAAGGGKTDCLLICAARNIENPSSRSLILRRTFPQLGEVIDRCWRYYPAFGGVYRSTEHRWHFPSGASVQIGHMQHESDKYNYQGKEYTFCVGADTEVLMADGSYLPIKNVSVGDMVETLIGPKEVTHIFSGIKKHSIEIYCNGFKQAQSLDHALLVYRDKCGVFLPTASFLPILSHAYQLSASPSLLKFRLKQQLLLARHFCLRRISKLFQSLSYHLSSLGFFFDSLCKGLEICFLSLSGNSRASLLLALSHQSFAMPHIPALPKFFSSTFQNLSSCDVSGVRYVTLFSDCHNYYSSGCDRHDGRLLLFQANGQESFQQLNGIVQPTPIYFGDDDQDKTHKHSFHKLLWAHPYTTGVYCSPLTYQEHDFSFSYIGLQDLVDIRVKDASHYITKGGFVNRNCGFDELTQFTESQYLYLHSRVRSTDPTIRPMVRATTNPGGIGHYWVKARFVDNVSPLETYIDPRTGLSRCFVPGKVYDNPTLIDNDPLYIKRLEALPEVERQRLLHGVWDIFEGQVFTELSQRVHGYEHFDPPPEWERMMAFDWGYSKPWAALYAAFDYDGIMWIYREVYGCKPGADDEGVRQTNTEIIDAIHEAESKDRVRPRMRIADPACWGPTKIGGSNTVLGPSFAEDASRAGLFFMRADNDRLRGIQQVHQRFKLETVVDDATGEIKREYPRCQIANSCEHWWRTMMTLRQNPRDVEDVDTKQEDHLYDCLSPETIVYTQKGPLKIKDAVGTKGKIATVGGAFTTYHDCKVYRQQSEMIAVIFSDGTEDVCTPDHRYLTERGMVEAKYLTDMYSYAIIPQNINGGMICNQPSLLESVRNLMESTITNAVNIIKKKECGYTERYGNISMEKYLTDLKYTILIATQIITALKILRLKKAQNILHYILKEMTTPTGLMPCTKGLLNGIEVKKDAHGTENITRKTVKNGCMSEFISYAPNVVNLSSLLSVLSSVLTTVNLHGAESPVSTILPQSVKYAGLNSPRTNTQKKELARLNVGGNCLLRKVVRIEDRVSADSYCLTADNTHLFAINSGSIVSNCFRYICLARPIIPQRKDYVPQGSFMAERRKYIRAREYARRHGCDLTTAYSRVR